MCCRALAAHANALGAESHREWPKHGETWMTIRRPVWSCLRYPEIALAARRGDINMCVEGSARSYHLWDPTDGWRMEGSRALSITSSIAPKPVYPHQGWCGVAPARTCTAGGHLDCRAKRQDSGCAYNGHRCQSDHAARHLAPCCAGWTRRKYYLVRARRCPARDGSRKDWPRFDVCRRRQGL